LKSLKKEFTGVSWFIEGDIKACFDTIDHHVLVGIIGNKIKDARLIKLIWKFLKAGYMEDWKYHSTHSGCPQGGVISPILSNIYLNELDKFAEKTAKEFYKPKDKRYTAEYGQLVGQRDYTRKLLKTATGQRKSELLKQVKFLTSELHKVPFASKTDKVIKYIRYADDFIIGVKGDKTDCERIKQQFSEFISERLKMELSEEKTLITHSSEKVRFLGYDICVRRNQEVKGHRMKSGTWRQSRTLHMKVSLTIPHREKIEKFLFAKGVIKQKKDGTYQPIHRASLLNLSDSEIVEQYNAEARGLCNYYNMAVDYHTLDYFCYLMEYSCLKTIANKHKSSIRKTIKKYKDGKTWSVPYETKYGTQRVKPVKIADCKRGEANDVIFRRKKFNWKTTIRQRLNAKVCELCETTIAELYEVHVVRNLNELGDSHWETVMKKKRRKTLVVCSKCHKGIHEH